MTHSQKRPKREASASQLIKLIRQKKALPECVLQEIQKNVRKTHDVVSTAIRHLYNIETSYRCLVGAETTSCVYKVPRLEKQRIIVFLATP